jgi:hypothetical protein
MKKSSAASRFTVETAAWMKARKIQAGQAASRSD